MSRAMKDSGVPWIGDMPNTWRIERGRHIFTLLERPVPEGAKVVTCFRDGEVTLRENRREEGFTISLKEIGYQGIEPGDLVVHGMDGFAGSIGISDSRGKCTPVLNILDSSQNKKFLMYYLRNMAYGEVFVSLATGIRQRSCDTNWKKLREIEYAVPPLEEQQRIADFLDIQTQEVDAAIVKTRESIEEYKKLKQAVITQAVTKGIRPNRSMKDSGVEWIDAIPGEWEIMKVLRTLAMPVTDGPHETPELQEEGIPFISAEAVSAGNGKIDFSHKWGNISQEYYEECCKKYKPALNDIYMIKSGATTGRVAIVETNELFTIWSPLAVFRSNPQKVHPKFLFYALQSETFFKQVELGWTFGTQQNIGMRTLEKLKVCLPSIHEQQEIAVFLDEKCGAIDALLEKKRQIITKLESYKKSLIYEYVTGKKEVPA